MLLHFPGQSFETRIASTGDFRAADLLIGIRDGVGIKGRLIRLGALADDLNQFGVPEGLHLQLAFAEDLKSLLIGDGSFRQFHFLAKPPGDPKLFNHRIEDLFALNHLELSLKKHRVKTLEAGLKNLQVLGFLFNPEDRRGFVNFGL